jgi:hypothetical protein
MTPKDLADHRGIISSVCGDHEHVAMVDLIQRMKHRAEIRRLAARRDRTPE